MGRYLEEERLLASYLIVGLEELTTGLERAAQFLGPFMEPFWASSSYAERDWAMIWHERREFILKNIVACSTRLGALDCQGTRGEYRCGQLQISALELAIDREER